MGLIVKNTIDTLTTAVCSGLEGQISGMFFLVYLTIASKFNKNDFTMADIFLKMLGSARKQLRIIRRQAFNRLDHHKDSELRSGKVA
jgi:AraC-like DNA-binding protein